MNHDEEYIAPWEKGNKQQCVPNVEQKNEAMQTAMALVRAQKELGLLFHIKDKNFNNISGTFENVEDLLKNPEFLSHLTQDMYVSDKDETTWFKLRLKNGKFVSLTFLMTFDVKWMHTYNKKFEGFDVTVVSFIPGKENAKCVVTAVPYCDCTPERILKHFKELGSQTANDSKEIGKLLCHILFKRINHPTREDKFGYFGDKQGFSYNSVGKLQFTPSDSLRNELKPYLTKSAINRQYPHCGEYKDVEKDLSTLFSDKIPLQILLLYNIASWHCFLFGWRQVFSDNILIAKPSAGVPSNNIAAILTNTHNYTPNTVAIGPNTKPLLNDLETINDGMVVVVDIYAADQVKKAEKGYDMMIGDTTGANDDSNGVHHISALISEYADMYIPKDKCSVLEFRDVSTDYSPETFKIALKRLGASMINNIVTDFDNGKYRKIFNNHVSDIKNNIPDTIPLSKINTFIMLNTALRMYNEFYSPLFSPEIEQYIEEWLCSQEQDRQPLNDVICSEYGKILNQRIADGYYHLILKEETTQIDKGSHTIVVDRNERRIYVETADSFDIAEVEMTSVADKDSLTAALYSGGYLPHNAKNEKSVRIAAITSDGTPYPLYVHAISYKLLTQENKLKFELLDKEANLFTYDEMPREGFLPLVKTVDGRFAGKMLRYAAEEANVYFGTGRIGSGKSWAIAQIICMLFMLGQIVVVFDVSGSYTKEKLLKMLPAEVVEKLFKFINIGAEYGMDMIPVDLGSLRGCETLPDKKRAIYSVLRAATGPLDKGTSRKLKGFLSDYLKDKEYSVSLNNLCSELEEAGGWGAEIADCVQSVLDDINEVGFEEQTWDDLFLHEHKIIVVNLGNEVGDSTHQLLDMLVGSLFNWQMNHDAGFLSIVIDELIDQDFSTGSPLQTLVKQGRKYHSALIGATQDYYNQGSSHLDVMKQANIKSFCRPGKSEDRVAQKLGYSNAVDAGFNKFKAGDTILEFDGYNKETGENEALTIKGRVVDFIETPLYEKFKEIYGCF